MVDGDWCFVAGTTGYDYATMSMPNDVAAQTANAIDTIERALTEGGFALADVVRVNYIVTDASYADAVFSVVGPRLADIRPAAMIIVAGLLKPEMKVEIEVTAKRRS